MRVGGGVGVAIGDIELAGTGCAVGTFTCCVGLGVGAALIVGAGDGDRVLDGFGLGDEGCPPPPLPAVGELLLAFGEGD